jgi:hypothetical protein
MTDDRRHQSDEDALDPQLEQAVSLLRRVEPVSRAWRDELLAQVPNRVPARGTIRPRRGRALVLWLPLGVAAALSVAVGIARSRAALDGPRVHFTVSAPSAKQVSLVGDFDGWNPAAHPMRRDAAGTAWVVDVRLPPGRHVFAFSVDGGLRPDPTAPRAVEDDFGVPSSVVVVAQRGGE